MSFLSTEVERVLVKNGIAFDKPDGSLYRCEEKGNAFDIQLHQNKNDPKMVDLFLRRIRGNLWTHKKLCGRLLEEMEL